MARDGGARVTETTVVGSANVGQRDDFRDERGSRCDTAETPGNEDAFCGRFRNRGTEWNREQRRR
ncbi:hypothetical protein [Haladaptatus salinisoli]|uniref:hypothetical protein n=1 Tax=Haladaptatus salinisoli TaxID=2884876 RepID=UPI001D0B9178|nr:hypothetical protein [Haladaptatus salinisoli]